MKFMADSIIETPDYSADLKVLADATKQIPDGDKKTEAEWKLAALRQEIDAKKTTADIRTSIDSLKRELNISTEKTDSPQERFQISDVKSVLESAAVSKEIAPSTLSGSFFAPLFSRGYTFSFEGSGVKIERSWTEQKDVNDLNTLINGYITSGKLSLDDLRTGLLYDTSSFNDFVTARTDKDGKVLNASDATLAKYVEFLKMKNPKSAADDAFLKSYGDGASYAALESTVVAKRAEKDKKVEVVYTTVVAEGIKTGKIDTWIGKIDVSSEASQKLLKNRDWKKTAQDFGNAPVGTTFSVAGDIVKASGSSAPIVFLGLLYLGFKALTGEFGTKNHKIAGWKIILGGLFAHGVSKAFGGPEALGKIIDGIGGDGTQDTPAETGNTGGKNGGKSGDKGGEKKEEKLTINQQELRDRLLANTEIRPKINAFVTEEKKKWTAGKTGTLEDYAKFISSTQFQEISPEYLIFNANHNESVFSLSPSLSSHISLPNNLDPLVFKRVMRTYLTTKDITTKWPKGDQDLGAPEKETFLQWNGLTGENMKEKKFQDVVNIVHEKIAKPSITPATTASVEAPTATQALMIENIPTGLTVASDLSSDKQKVTIKFSPEVINNGQKITQLILQNTNNSVDIRFNNVDYKMVLNGNKISFTK